MSLIKPVNSDIEVEMNLLELLRLKDGWNGGQWSNWDVVNNPENYDFYIENKRGLFKTNVVSGEVSGSDYDMGHTYHWSWIRLFVVLDTILGEVEVHFDKFKGDCSLYYLEKWNVHPNWRTWTIRPLLSHC